MKGKIFPESTNSCQDQAKILFNYYQQAAEKIVAEEERLEKQIAVLEERKAQLEKEIAGLWVWFLTIILFFIYFIKKSGLMKQIADVDTRIGEFRKQHDEIFRDYKVTKLGVAYVPVAEQIKYEDRSFIVDYTGRVPESEVTLQLSRQNDLLIDTIGRLEKLSEEAPIVESSEDAETVETGDYSTSIQQLNQHDYLGSLERSLRTISYCMDDLDTTSVSLPLVADRSDYLQFLKEFATRDLPEKAVVVPVFDKERYTESVKKFQVLNQLKDSLSTKTQQFEDVLKSLMSTIAHSVQAISALKVASVDKVVLESNKVLYQILKSPYNQYSPMLEFEEIERVRNEQFDYSEDVQNYKPFNLRQSSRMRYNLVTGMWTSEDGNTSSMPFGVHQLYEEIVAPIVQNLMAENRVERLKIYNHIKDQKIDYLNKWHQDTDAFYRANRAESADIINLMQESLREYVAAYNTLVSLQKTEDSMVQSNGELESTVVDVVDNTAETLAAFELQSQEFQKTQADFEEYMERLKDDIDLKAEKFGYIEYYDAKLRDGYSHDAAVATKEIHELDERRKALASVNPLFAKTTELPPQPNVEPITFEHISLNLPVIAKAALEDLDAEPEEDTIGVPSEAPDTEAPAEDAGSPASGDSGEDEDAGEDPEAQDDEAIEEDEDGYEGEEDEDDEGEDDDEDEDEEDDEEDEEDEEDEDDDEDEDEDDEEEGEPLTREDLEEMSDDELKEILDYIEMEYSSDPFDREAVIEAILEYQEYQNEPENE